MGKVLTRGRWAVSPRYAAVLLLALTTPIANADPVFLLMKGQAIGSQLTLNSTATDIQVVGNFAYLAWAHPTNTNHPGGLEIFSLTNRFVPVRVGNYESSWQVNAVRVVGDHAYLAVGTARTLTNDPGGLEIINVANPANPVRAGQIGTLGKANDVQVAGNRAYVPESTRWTGTNLLGALEIFDVSAPSQPSRTGVYDTLGEATSVEISGNYAYLADGVTDLRVLDVSMPSNPVSVGVYDVDERIVYFAEFASPARHLERVNNVIYSAADTGLHFLDVSNPSNPVSIAGGAQIPFPYAFHVSAPHLFMVFYNSVLSQFVLSVGHTSFNLQGTGWEPLLFWPRAMDVAGDCLYFAAAPPRVYQMSDRPTITSISCTNGTVTLAWNTWFDVVLLSTASLENPDWIEVPGSVGVNGITLPMAPGKEFFRLLSQ